MYLSVDNFTIFKHQRKSLNLRFIIINIDLVYDNSNENMNGVVQNVVNKG